jgi:3-oxoacyl-[acyl-carrier protein] reductase
MGCETRGKAAFVTCGTEEECAKLCLELARRGFSVGFTHRPDDAGASDLASRIKSLGVPALALPVSRTGPELAAELSAAVVRTAEELGCIDMLFYLSPAAAGGGELLLDLDEGDWDAAMDAGPRGFFLCCKYALPYLINRGGARVVVLDAGGDDPNLVEGASREAFKKVAEGVSAELSSYGVSVVWEKISGDGWIDGLVDN